MAFANASFASLRPIQLDPARVSPNCISQLPSLTRIKTAGACVLSLHMLLFNARGGEQPITPLILLNVRLRHIFVTVHRRGLTPIKVVAPGSSFDGADRKQRSCAMGGVAMNPRQIDPLAVQGWPVREIDLPLGRSSADGAFPGTRDPSRPLGNSDRARQ
jgi:hypothetical protein